MTFSERPAPAVVTLPTTETLPGSATRDRPGLYARMNLALKDNPSVRAMVPGGGCAAYLSGGRSPLRCPCYLTMMLPSRLGCPLSLKTPNMGNPGLE